MAVINGTVAAETLGGTNDADVITGFGGADSINGAGGDDTIVGVAAGGNYSGGDGDDVLEVELADADSVVDGASTVDGLAVTLDSIEFVKVTNASDFMLEVGEDAVFGFDQVLTADATGAGPGATEIAAETFIGGTVDEDGIDADEDAGVMINGVVYEDGDEYETPNGGTVAVAWTGSQWTFEYTASDASLLFVGDSGDDSDDLLDDTLEVVVTTVDGDEVTINVVLAVNNDEDIDASGEDGPVTLVGDGQDNDFIGTDEADYMVGKAGADDLDGGEGNDTIYAGEGDDTVTGGLGDDELGGGAGDDSITGDEGDDIMYGGAGNDTIEGDDGDDIAWAGSGDDEVFGDDGDDVLGGGAGEDSLYGGNGDDIIYSGADDDYVEAGDDNDTVYGGAGDDEIYGGAGDDVLYNGTGDDSVYGDDGEDAIWGGAGDDELTGGNEDDIFGFVAGNGNDTIMDFEFGAAAGEGDVLDLTALGFANTQAVLDAMSDVGANATLAVGPGQTITFDGIAKAAFQAAMDDWVLV